MPTFPLPLNVTRNLPFIKSLPTTQPSTELSQRIEQANTQLQPDIRLECGEHDSVIWGGNGSFCKGGGWGLRTGDSAEGRGYQQCRYQYCFNYFLHVEIPHFHSGDLIWLNDSAIKARLAASVYVRRVGRFHRVMFRSDFILDFVSTVPVYGA